MALSRYICPITTSHRPASFSLCTRLAVGLGASLTTPIALAVSCHSAVCTASRKACSLTDHAESSISFNTLQSSIYTIGALTPEYHFLLVLRSHLVILIALSSQKTSRRLHRAVSNFRVGGSKNVILGCICVLQLQASLSMAYSACKCDVTRPRLDDFAEVGLWSHVLPTSFKGSSCEPFIFCISLA